MDVGINYPWRDYGWDFGLGPPAWRGPITAPRWSATIDDHLRHFHDLGISVVRWFVLADGLTYGTGAHAPRPIVDAPTGWSFVPPALADEVVSHFEALLQRFAASNVDRLRPIQLLPVLIDFHFCQPGTMCVQQGDPSDPYLQIDDPGWVKQGRADALTDTDKRRRFLDAVLDPLLCCSQRYADVIYAWELINEPEWVTAGWHPDGRTDHPVDEASMRAFLEEGKARVRSAGFKPTIGFALHGTLHTSGITADINQFHHYPGGRTPLPGHSCDPDFPAIIGEFATASDDCWPELVGDCQTVLDRLQVAEALGYPLALPWSFLSHDRHTCWSAHVEDTLRVFRDRRDAGG
jgi:hypothetical protein